MTASYARVFYPFTISEKDYRLFSAAQNMVALRHGAKDTIFDFSAAYDGIFFCFFSFLTHVLTQNGKKYTETAEPSSPESSRFCMQCCQKWPEMVNCAILKQLITRRSQVRVLSPQPESPDFARNQDFFHTFVPNNLLPIFLTQTLTPTGYKLYPRKWTRDFDPWSRSADTHLTHRGRSAAPVL